MINTTYRGINPISKIWTDRENEIIKRGCEENKSSREISKLLPERSVNAIDLHIRSLEKDRVFGEYSYENSMNKMINHRG